MSEKEVPIWLEIQRDQAYDNRQDARTDPADTRNVPRLNGHLALARRERKAETVAKKHTETC
jgi:hypothetical protein